MPHVYAWKEPDVCKEFEKECNNNIKKCDEKLLNINIFCHVIYQDHFYINKKIAKKCQNITTNYLNCVKNTNSQNCENIWKDFMESKCDQSYKNIYGSKN